MRRAGRAAAQGGGTQPKPRAPGRDLCARSTRPVGAGGARNTRLPARVRECLIGPTAITADCFPNKQCQREAATRRKPSPKGAPVQLTQHGLHPAIKAFITLFSPLSCQEDGSQLLQVLARSGFACVTALGSKSLFLHCYQKEFYSD